MARFNLFNFIALALLLPAALALPFDINDVLSLPPYASPSSSSKSNSFPTAAYPSWTGATATAAGSPYPTATGTAKGTAWSYPTGESPHEHQHESWALKKRRAFEGPRRDHFPHYYPPHEQYASSTPTFAPTSYATGTASSWPYPTHTGSGSYTYTAHPTNYQPSYYRR